MSLNSALTTVVDESTAVEDVGETEVDVVTDPSPPEGPVVSDDVAVVEEPSPSPDDEVDVDVESAEAAVVDESAPPLAADDEVDGSDPAVVLTTSESGAAPTPLPLPVEPLGAAGAVASMPPTELAATST